MSIVLRSKLIIFDFVLSMFKYDILCFTEIKTDETGGIVMSDKENWFIFLR